jgi:tetratricopeptide (TPR) repeat protein
VPGLGRALGLLALALCVAPVRADELRNVKIGQPVPPFVVPALSGQTLKSSELRGKVLVVVYVAAEQKSSEAALSKADAIARALDDQELAVVSLTADVTRVAFFRSMRDRLSIHHPMGLDVGREVYGALGLVVLPTTIVVDREGRLVRVISSYKSDYEHVLGSYVRHALGLIDDDELEEELTTRTYQRNRASDRIARRRASARLLRESGLDRDAENELRAALEIDPAHADTRLDLAMLYVDDERLEEAGTLAAAVLKDDPGHRRGKLVLGIVHYHRGRLDEAEALLREALLLNPDPIRTHYYLGLISEQRGDQSAAITHFKEALGRLLRRHPG